MRLRFFLISSFFFLAFSVLEYQLYNLQILKRDFYFNKAEALSALQEELLLSRGQILFTDRHGNKIPAAHNKSYPVIYAVPAEIKNPVATAAKLSPALSLSEKELENNLDNPKSQFRALVEKASPETINAISTLKLAGIHVYSKDYRYYPFEKLAAHLLGFVGFSEKDSKPTGLYGLEKLYNKSLSENQTLRLTIDRNIQNQAESILKRLIDDNNATGGTVIVMEPSSGKILALANLPDFNPNSYSESELSSFINPAIQSIYEPGSVFKPITMAAGIDSGAITPETTFFDSGQVVLNGKKITNWNKKVYGRVTMTNVIEHSINTGSIFAAQKTGREKFIKYVKKFGFSEPTKIDLPDEVAGSIKNLERKNSAEVDFATASFGQGTAVTPMQMINALNVFANSGTLLRPYLNASSAPYEIRRVVSEETAKKVTAMMESAVNKAGVASLPQYRLAGKTGTAQIADHKHGGYLEEFVHTFIGFGPVSNPRFIALIKIDRPSVELAGQTVVPAFRELARFVLSYYNVPPDKVVASNR